MRILVISIDICYTFVTILIKDSQEQHEDEDSPIPEDGHAAGQQLLEHFQLHLLWQWHVLHHYVEWHPINTSISRLEKNHY